MTVWQSKGVACWYCVSHSACAPFPPPGFITCRQGKLSWLFFSLRMGTSAALRAAPMAAFTLLISADAIVNQTASTTFLTSILTGSAPVFQIVHHAVLIFRAKIGAMVTVSRTIPLPLFLQPQCRPLRLLPCSEPLRT